MKKLIIRSSALALLGVSLVNTAQAHGECRHPQGLMVGLNAGYVLNTSRLDRTYVALPQGSDTVRLSGNGLIGGITAGAAFNLSSVFVIPEFSANYVSAKSTFTENPIGLIGRSMTVKMKDVYGFSVRIGAPARGVYPYIKLGYANGRFTTTSSDLIFGNGTGSKRLNGFEGGLGVDFPISQLGGNAHPNSESFVVGAEYAHTHFFAKLSYQDGTASYRMRPFTDSFMLHVKFILGSTKAHNE